MTRQAVNIQRWRERKKALGLCVRCGHKPAIPNRTHCIRCSVLKCEAEQQRKMRTHGFQS